MRAEKPPQVGERIRIAMHYGGDWRPLLWLRVGTDGSIYIGLLLGQPTSGAKGSATGEKVIDIKYKDGRPVTPKDLKKGSRVSFKASGEIHLGADTLKGESLEQLPKPRQLCLALFAHPSRYRPPAKHSVNDYDVAVVDYPVDDAQPLYTSVEVAPWSGGAVVAPQGLPHMKVWQSFAFGFAGLTRTPNYALGVTIGHGVEGPWPTLPHLAIVSRR
jgi:hypothetical protein